MQDCSKVEELKKEKYRLQIACAAESEILKLTVAISDHLRFWHPHNCD